MYVIEFPLQAGGVVGVEVAEDPVGAAPAGRGVQQRAEETFDAVVARIGPVAEALLAGLQRITRPQEIAVEFGVTLSTKSGVVLVSADAEATIKVSIKWNPDKD